MEFYGCLVHPPAQFVENTNVALKIQTFLRISIQEKGGHKADIILNNTNGKLAWGHGWRRQVEFLSVTKVLGGVTVDFTDI